MDKQFLLILVLGIGTKGFTQTNAQTMGWQYSFYPSGKEYTTVSKTEIFANFNSKFDQLSLGHALRVEMDRVDLPVEYWAGGSNEFNIYDLHYTINASYPISEYAEFHMELKPTLTSTFENSLSSEDVFLYGSASALWRGEIVSRPSYVRIGIAYSNHLGAPEFLPVLAFSAMVSEKFSFQLGFPESHITYRLKPWSTISARFNYEGKYVNLSVPMVMEDNDPAKKLKWEWASLGINYSHELGSLWSIDLGAGYLLKNNFSLRNENEETVSTIKQDPSPFLSSGIKLKLN